MQQLKNAIQAVREKQPLVLTLTNFVTMDFIANCLLAIGAAPIMSVCDEELEELINISSVIYLNIGTLDSEFVTRANKAIEFATQYQKPIVLDPVGAGATQIRTQTASEYASHASIIRGNASEILALGNQSFTTKGVESTHSTDDATDIADQLANQNNTTIIISGATDYITNGHQSFRNHAGSPLMANVTGMGCAMTAVIAAMHAVITNPFEAGVIGTQYFSLCGETAALANKNPGSFKVAFIDQLYSANLDQMCEQPSMECHDAI